MLVFNKISAISALALIASVQLVPAPFLALIPEAIDAGLASAEAAIEAAGDAAGEAAGAAGDGGGDGAGDGAGAGERRRDIVLGGNFSRVKRQSYGNEQDWQTCHDQLTTSSLVFSGPHPGVVVVTGMPPACMDLATVITGKFDEGDPIPLSSNSVKFTGLSNDDVMDIQSALDARS